MPVSPSKWLLAGLAAAALLAAIVLGAGLWVQANTHRIGPLVIAAVQQATGRRLTLSGPVRPIFALRPGLSAEHLTLQNAAWASRPDMAQIGRRLGGTLVHPSITLDKTRSAITVGKAVGGTLLLGPIGAEAALLSAPSGEANPCLNALATAAGVEAAAPEEPGHARKAVKGVKEGVQGLGRSLQKTPGK
jgi:hypothetical protein